MRELLRRYALYLVRWQLSTPILAVCVYYLTQSLGATWTTIVANFIGGLLFYWVDRWIFTRTDILHTGELWEAVNNVVCVDCGANVPRGYRLVKTRGYDRSRDRNPEFRCHQCSRAKYERIRQTGPTDAPAGPTA
jgi:hypothetical protein